MKQSLHVSLFKPQTILYNECVMIALKVKHNNYYNLFTFVCRAETMNKIDNLN